MQEDFEMVGMEGLGLYSRLQDSMLKKEIVILDDFYERAQNNIWVETRHENLQAEKRTFMSRPSTMQNDNETVEMHKDTTL